MSADKTHRILREIHRPSLDAETRDHRTELEATLLGRLGELYGDDRAAAGARPARRFGPRLRLAAAALGLVIVALGAGAIPIDHEVPLGHEIVLQIPGAGPDRLPPLEELLEASRRLANAASVSVDVALAAEGSTVTVLLLGDGAAPSASTDPARRLADGLRELDPALAAARVASRELIGVFPRSFGEVLGRKLFAVELGAGELAAARREILTVLGDTDREVDVQSERQPDGRRVIRIRIDPDE